jgi:hypothetical protein
MCVQVGRIKMWNISYAPWEIWLVPSVCAGRGSGSAQPHPIIANRVIHTPQTAKFTQLTRRSAAIQHSKDAAPSQSQASHGLLQCSLAFVAGIRLSRFRPGWKSVNGSTGGRDSMACCGESSLLYVGEYSSFSGCAGLLLHQMR